ncbi:hypothetical protein M011DRAFT_92578 [Sporormia fimetaria CBS 119925]|uniref:Uncharacterized protein n=1 Tax=Sporormia fimetaria CBS 119925 TaxID=1340428 RepID=A0A6A6V8B0_9PLEO|nr:hypothetical protein M011DRAFT_92578 [Sporormia fimetaria CBS 119925]
MYQKRHGMYSYRSSWIARDVWKTSSIFWQISSSRTEIAVRSGFGVLSWLMKSDRRLKNALPHSKGRNPPSPPFCRVLTCD